MAAGELREPGRGHGDTVYVASYFAPNGNYAGDNNFFTSAA